MRGRMVGMLANGTRISVAMIARNEENNLPRTLAALMTWVDEVVVVDSGSKDRTPEIVREAGAQHHWNLDFKGHAEQKNVAIAKCTGDWILLLDADEVVTPALAAEIQSALMEPKFEAYSIPRLNLFLTTWMRHGGLYPDRKLRLFKRGSAMVDESIGPHGTPKFGGNRGTLTAELRHYGYPDFANYLDHMNEYSSDGVPAMLSKGAGPAAMVLQSWVNPIFSFVKNYVFRAGFLDGYDGLIFHANHAVYVHWKYVKAWDALRRRQGA
jgi:glycosyltransferase involved in cell wall biosynthesis